MYTRIVILITCFTLHLPTAWSQNRIIVKGNDTLHLKMISKYGDGADTSYLLSIQYKGRELHRHILFEKYTDCNSVSLALGTYRLRGSCIQLYSYWAHAGDAPASPYGFRKQDFYFGGMDTLILQDSAIYMETSYIDNEFIEGSAFIQKKSLHAEDLITWNNYKNTIEKYFRADFKEGAESKKLIAEVRKVLADPIRSHTSAWKRFYRNSFDIKY